MGCSREEPRFLGARFNLNGSRDIGRGAQPWVEGAYALRQGLPSGNQIHAEVRLPQAAGP
jgi:hypothetical protein